MMRVHGIEVETQGLPNVTEQEVQGYIDRIRQTTDERIERLSIQDAGDGNVSLEYSLRPQKFERIRRITGYLVGTTDRWNNAKRAEEKDRVKHGLN